jgi:hypothetical protein
MKRISVVAIAFLVFIFLEACNGVETPVVVVTMHPSAVPLVMTMTEIAKTVEVLGQTVTVYASTPTPSHTPVPPTKVPDATELKNLLSSALKDKLIATFGAKISVEAVKFGPIAAPEYTELYIEMNCESANNSVCPSSQVIIAVVDTCKEKKKKLLENIPNKTQVLTITIYDPGHSPQIVEVDWSDALAYINGDIPAEIFGKLIRYVQE